MSFDKNKEMLKDMLEEILFGEKKLDALKKIITEFNNGVGNAKSIKEELFLQRQEIFNELLDFFPFYVEHLEKSKAIDDFSGKFPEHLSSEEIKKRDELLVEILNRLKTIKNELKIS